MILGRTQIAILRTVADGRPFVAKKDSMQRACLRLHQRGLLARDRLASRRWHQSGAGVAAIREHDDALFAKLGDALDREIARQDAAHG